VHLYRAEVGRMTAFRVRLDTTTNWAITSTAVVATFALGNSRLAHAALLLLMLLNYFFLHLEARRYRHYEVSRRRVQLLERGFYPEILRQDVDSRWLEELMIALRDPRPPLSQLQGMGWRLRRNYLWIYLVVLLTWLATLDLAGGPPASLQEFAARAALGSLPGWPVLGSVIAFYGWLLVLAFGLVGGYSPGEEW
jgi:uncharacterized membrane protein